jgi:diguanylate cyclase (GGDEF)-like protein
MSAVLSAAVAAGPLAAGWAAHARVLLRRMNTARRDPLTGLWTRAPFEVRARRLLAGGPRAVLLLDLNDFKATNDTFGHWAGDEVIAATGRRLGAWAERHEGIAARLGGDEFTAVIPSFNDTDARHALGDLLARLREPIAWELGTLEARASVGVALTDPRAGAAELSTALRLADEAMYGVKQTAQGRSQWMFASPTPTAPTVNGRRDGRRGTDGGTWR